MAGLLGGHATELLGGIVNVGRVQKQIRITGCPFSLISSGFPSSQGLERTVLRRRGALDGDRQAVGRDRGGGANLCIWDLRKGFSNSELCRIRAYTSTVAEVAVEKYNAGTALELDQLHGTWLLQYTSAPDVTSLLQATELPFLQVGQVYQRFDCRGKTDGGSVQNIVRWSISGLLQETEGATLTVTAQFFVASPRSIVLLFEEARVGEVRISDVLQGWLAPAVLPRTFFSMQVLQFLRSLEVRVPLGGQAITEESRRRAPIGLRYYLTFLDNDMLLGRALGSGGMFVFSRTQPLQIPQL